MAAPQIDGDVVLTVDTLARRMPLGWRITAASRVGGRLCVEVEGPGGKLEACECSDPNCAYKQEVVYPVTLGVKQETPQEVVEGALQIILRESMPAGSA
jgi:hypothetical protein